MTFSITSLYNLTYTYPCLLIIRYDAGDHVAVYPVNDPLIVEAIGKRLNVDLDQMFTLNNVDGLYQKPY